LLVDKATFISYLVCNQVIDKGDFFCQLIV